MNLNEPFVITVSREIGSGGRTVGRTLARKLETRFCDKAILKGLEDKFQLSQYGIEKLKGEKKTWLTSLIQMVAPLPSASSLELDRKFATDFRTDVTSEDLFKAETEILTALADEGSCVIAGRSGFYVFRDHPNHLNVFITASRENRIKRVMAKQGLTEEQASALIDDIDKKRENYIKNFTGTSRYDARNYDLVICADDHSEEEITELILKYIGK